jgi:FdhD protein
MGTPETSKSQPVLRLKEDLRSTGRADLIVEEPLSIRVNGEPYAVVMRTPGDETCHVAGFCLAEGLIDRPEDIVTVSFCTEEGTNVATATLTEARRAVVADLLQRKGFVSQTSCGICGKKVVKDMQQILRPLPSRAQVSANQIRAAVSMLSQAQSLYDKTRGAHAALIVDNRNTLMAAFEDAGRHNALDKAIGRVFLEHKLASAVMGVMSSRLSYELVQKAARGGLEILIGLSRPTFLAVELAMSVNMTLVCSQEGQLLVFTCPERIKNQNKGGLMEATDYRRIIKFALKNEVEARNFYRDAARKLENPSLKTIFTELAGEEQNHFDILQDLGNRNSLDSVFDKAGDYGLSETVDAPELSTDMLPADAFALAMKKEEAAMVMYTRLADACESRAEKNVFLELAQMERNHKKKMEDAFVNIGYPEKW